MVLVPESVERFIKRRYLTARHKFFKILDDEGVGIFQVIVYAHIGPAAALYGMLIAGGTPQAVEDAMGPHFNGVWLWLCLGISFCLVGKLISHDAGMWMQLSGDLAASGSLLVYIVATLDSAWWGKALYAVFLTAAIFECTLLLIVRDIRRIGIDLGWFEP